MSPFGPGEFMSARALVNREFLDDVLARARRHHFFSHAFLSGSLELHDAPEVVSALLTSFYKIVIPFTGLLCTLAGRAPDLRSRFALMANIHEEMGCGDLSAAHPSLYVKMLESIGVSEEEAEAAPRLRAVRRINEHLSQVVEQRPFPIACAVLASAEATIPPSFPVLARLAQGAFRAVDTTFFDRHGVRDERHSDDAALLFALGADGISVRDGRGRRDARPGPARRAVRCLDGRHRAGARRRAPGSAKQLATGRRAPGERVFDGVTAETSRRAAWQMVTLGAFPPRPRRGRRWSARCSRAPADCQSRKPRRG